MDKSQKHNAEQQQQKKKQKMYIVKYDFIWKFKTYKEIIYIVQR